MYFRALQPEDELHFQDDSAIAQDTKSLIWGVSGFFFILLSKLFFLITLLSAAASGCSFTSYKRLQFTGNRILAVIVRHVSKFSARDNFDYWFRKCRDDIFDPPCLMLLETPSKGFLHYILKGKWPSEHPLNRLHVNIRLRPDLYKIILPLSFS